jgi:hypothetical protein
MLFNSEVLALNCFRLKNWRLCPLWMIIVRHSRVSGETVCLLHFIFYVSSAIIFSSSTVTHTGVVSLHGDFPRFSKTSLRSHCRFRLVASIWATCAVHPTCSRGCNVSGFEIVVSWCDRFLRYTFRTRHWLRTKTMFYHGQSTAPRCDLRLWLLCRQL